MEAQLLENYYQRLVDVLEVTEKLDQNDLEYCKLLTLDELSKQRKMSDAIDQVVSTLISNPLTPSHEIISILNKSIT